MRKTREGESCGFHEAQFFLIDFDPLSERVEVIAAAAAAMAPIRLHAPEMWYSVRRVESRPEALSAARCRLIARGLQLTDSVVQHGVEQIGDAMFQNAGSDSLTGVVFILLGPAELTK